MGVKNLLYTIDIDRIVSIGMLLVMTLVVVVAIFEDKIRAWFTRPNLNVSIQMSPPDCHQIPIGQPPLEADGYYFRLRVTNLGSQKAELVEVFAAELSSRLPDGRFEIVKSFLPMNLSWSHLHGLFFPAISRGIYKHCDLAHIIDPQKRHQFAYEDKSWPNIPSQKTILSFDTVVKPNTLSHLVPFGVYRLVILVAAANAQSIRKTLEISLSGDWYDDEQQMLSEGIGIKLLA